ncbi:MAG: hypothetical protein JXR20_01395 [Balneola sp.]
MLRTDMGFEIYNDGEGRMLGKEKWQADDFVYNIFELEGLDPELNLKLFRQVKRKFTNRFGNEI